MKTLLTVIVTLAGAGIAGAVTMRSGGLLNFAADEPHLPVVEGVIGAARERFIAARSEGLQVPDLADPALVASGAAHYVAMCAGCHLGPGAVDTEIRRGLYPQPPDLAHPGQHGAHQRGSSEDSAKRQFWIIKHGIKMTAMPAWGATHSDDEIWGLVAFLRKLPEMSPEEYAKLQEPAADSSHPHRPDHHGRPPGAGPRSDVPEPRGDEEEHGTQHRH